MGLPERVATDAVRAIVDFERQLRGAGIHLVFMPLPVKPFIYPEHVWPGYPAAAGPAWNRDRDAFKFKLAAAGVDVLDITDDLWNAKASIEGEPLLEAGHALDTARAGGGRRSARSAREAVLSPAGPASLHDP